MAARRDEETSVGRTPSHRWHAPPSWPAPPPGWSPPRGWLPSPDWPPPPPNWRWWQRTRAGRIRLAALAAALLLPVGAGVLVVAALVQDVVTTAPAEPVTTFVNDTTTTWEVLACTSDYYPDATVLAPGQRWVPQDWPAQDDPGAGCWLVPTDRAGHLGPGVCLAVPESQQRTFTVSRAWASSLAACMARSEPSL